MGSCMRGTQGSSFGFVEYSVQYCTLMARRTSDILVLKLVVVMAVANPGLLYSVTLTSPAPLKDALVERIYELTSI
jgi:hypothetical protein